MMAPYDENAMEEINYCYMKLLIEFVLILLFVSTNLEEK
jgi:hypothetical protein